MGHTVDADPGGQHPGGSRAPAVSRDGDPPDVGAVVGSRSTVLGVVWGAVPRWLRRTLVSVVGGTLVLCGLALVVVPGPFTLPLLVAGFAVLGTEFAWAAAVLAHSRRGLERAGRLGRSAAGSVTSVVSRRPRRR